MQILPIQMTIDCHVILHLCVRKNYHQYHYMLFQNRNRQIF